MFGDQRGGFTGNQVNVNTRCDVFYSDTARLDVGLWNGFISIQIAPSIGVDARGIRQYEQDRQRIMNTTIKFDKLETLLEGVSHEVIPSGIQKASKSVSISSTSTVREQTSKKLTTIGYDQESDSFYFEVTMNLSVTDGTGSPEQGIRFTFEPKEYLVDYDITSGSSTAEKSQSDFTRFMKLLNSYQRTIPMEQHGVNYANSFKRQYNTNQGGYQQNYTQSNQMQQMPQQYNAPVTSVEGGFNDLDLPF